MSNRTIFNSTRGHIANTDTNNRAGGKAYSLSDKETLAKLVMCGTFQQTYYASGEEQLQVVLEVAQRLDSAFLGKCAIYARQQGYMKDTPALLLAILASRTGKLEAMQALENAWPVVIDNGRMLRNFCQIMRSGVTGRRSFGTYIKELIQSRLESWDDDYLFRASVGTSPSLTDVIKMVHPKPSNPKREALYGYLLGKNGAPANTLAMEWENMKASPWRKTIPRVPIQMLYGIETDAENKKRIWKHLADNARYQETRMNLNNYMKYGVFGEQAMVDKIAKRLRDRDLVEKSRQFPYQLMTSYFQTQGNVPSVISASLLAAMEHSLRNITAISNSHVYIDVSSSMFYNYNGRRQSLVRPVDIAALIGAALHVKAGAEVYAVDTRLYEPRGLFDSGVMKVASELASFGGGGTRLGLCGAHLNHDKLKKPDLVVIVSDNESWKDSSHYGGSQLMEEWETYKRRNKQAKLVLLDVVPNSTSQANTRRDVLNIGGFSDKVFDVIAAFSKEDGSSTYWTDIIESL